MAGGEGLRTGAQKAEEHEVESAAAGEKPPAPKHRLSKRDIRRILNHTPMIGAPRAYEELKLRNPGLKPSPEEERDGETSRLYRSARSFYEHEENYPKLQERVRRELETKGYVEVDGDWVKWKAEVQAVIDELWKKIELILQEDPQTEDEDDGGSDSDSSDEDKE